MTSARRIVEVAGDRAQLLNERTSDYRTEVVRTLLGIIKLQSEGTGPQARRDRVLKLVGDLGSNVARQGGQR